MIKFYYAPSPNPAKVALFLEEAGLPYEVVPIDTRKGEQHDAAFLAINPNGKTPALTDGNVKLFDSTAILLYLARKTGTFLVEDTEEHQAQMLSWLMLVATGVGPYSGQAVHFKFHAPEPKEYAENRYTYEAERHWGLIEARLANREYMVGDTYSIVDMSIWGWGRALPLLFGPETWPKYPNIKRFIDLINARPAAERAANLAQKYTFKQEMDDDARRHMFPQNERLKAR